MIQNRCVFVLVGMCVRLLCAAAASGVTLRTKRKKKGTRLLVVPRFLLLLDVPRPLDELADVERISWRALVLLQRCTRISGFRAIKAAKDQRKGKRVALRSSSPRTPSECNRWSATACSQHVHAPAAGPLPRRRA